MSSMSEFSLGQGDSREHLAQSSFTRQPPANLKARKREKLPILAGLLATDAISIYLLVLKRKTWMGPLWLAELIQLNPTGVGILVQVISRLLGIINISALCIAIKLSTRARLATRSIRLESLKLINALAGNQIDWSFRNLYLLFTILFVAFNLLPAALWAGAITPVLLHNSGAYDLPIPDYSNAKLLINDGSVVFSNSSYKKVNDLGTFTFFPERDFVGYIIGDAREAISPSGGISPHAKLDKSGYLYTTRSFGIASSVGLTDTFPVPALSYRYNEIGLKISTDCIYNQSALVWMEKLDTNGSGLSFNIYNAKTCLPPNWGRNFADPCGASAATAMGDDQAFFMGVSSDLSPNSTMGLGSKSYISLATYGNRSQYSVLDKVQCAVAFKPFNFLVSVNTTSKTIAVEPQNATDPFLHAEGLSQESMWRLGDLGSTMQMTQWTSVLGDMFLNNAAVSGINGSTNATVLHGVGSAIESMLDNILQATSAAQLIIVQDNQTVTAEVQYWSFVLSDLKYIYGILVVNLLVTIVFVTELVRTRTWRDAPLFDFSDIKAVILNSSIPNNGIAAEAESVAKSSSIASRQGNLGRINIAFADTAQGTKLHVPYFE